MNPRFLPYILKTLWRHRSRTLLTVAGSAVALFVFCFVAAIQRGMDDLRTRQDQQQSLVSFQANKFCPATSHLPQDYERRIAKLEGVREVVPIQVFTNNCRASLDVVVFYGVPADRLSKIRQFELREGDWSAFERNQDSALVGEAVANRRGIRTGEKFSIGGITVFVAGIFSCENLAEENYFYVHLDFLQRRRGANSVGTVTQFEVLINDGVDPAAKGREIDDLFRGGPVATDTRSKGVFQARSLGDLTELISMTHYLGLACIGIVLALVATTTLMSVQDRIKEHAVLQTIGFSGRRIFGLVLSESVLLSAAGGALGVAVAMFVLRQSGLALSAEAVSVAFQPSLALALLGLAISIGTGIIAGLVPACQAARVEIIPALRNG